MENIQMKYLFFDAESVDIKHKLFCTYGYDLADSNLNSLDNKDIVFNPDIPKDEYDWRVIRQLLFYNVHALTQLKTFPHFYKEIKRLMSKPDVICVGFEVEEDVRYVLHNCLKYSQEPINFKYIDVREIMQIITNEKPRGLAMEYARWCHQQPKYAHRSDFDAFMTRELLKAILKKERTTLGEFLENNPQIIGKAENWCYGYNETLTDIREEKPKSQYRKLKKGEEDKILKGSENWVLYNRFLDNVKKQEEAVLSEFLQNKKISISLNYENNNYKNMLKIIQLIANAGGEYIKKASLADIFVTFDEKIEESGKIKECLKHKYVLQANQNGANIQIINFDEFLKMFKLDTEKLNQMPEINIEYLKDAEVIS